MQIYHLTGSGVRNPGSLAAAVKVSAGLGEKGAPGAPEMVQGGGCRAQVTRGLVETGLFPCPCLAPSPPGTGGLVLTEGQCFVQPLLGLTLRKQEGGLRWERRGLLSGNPVGCVTVTHSGPSFLPPSLPPRPPHVSPSSLWSFLSVEG